MTEKVSFWLKKEDQTRIYGEELPRNYHGESRPPHYIYYKQMIEGELIKFSTGKTIIAEALKIAPGMLKDRLKKDKPISQMRYTFGNRWPHFYASKVKQVKSEDIRESTLGVIDTVEPKVLEFWRNKFVDTLDKPFKHGETGSWEAEYELFEASFREKYPVETMFNVLKYLNAFARWLHENGIARRKVRFKDPKAKTERKARKKSLGRTLAGEEVQLLIEAADPVQKVVVLLGYDLAFRISDAANLSWDMINLDPADPYIEFAGDDKEETFTKAPLTPGLCILLTAMKAISKSRWVFPQIRDLDRPRGSQTFEMEKVFRAAGIPFTFKILRHTRLTLDFSNTNIPDSDVMAMRRVSLKVALEHYIHPSHENRKRMVDQRITTLSYDVKSLVSVLKLYLLGELQNAPSEEEGNW